METTIFDAIANFGGIVILAGALLTGIVMTKTAHEGVMKERDKADAQRDARLEDQKTINRELTSTLNVTADALKRLADLYEARDRLEAQRASNVQKS
jgi:hypothetical protein